MRVGGWKDVGGGGPAPLAPLAAPARAQWVRVLLRTQEDDRGVAYSTTWPSMDPYYKVVLGEVSIVSGACARTRAGEVLLRWRAQRGRCGPC